MKLPRRTFLHLAAGAAALPGVARFAWAQTYPTRPVRWIIPFPPGGGADIVSRIMAAWLSDRLGQPIIIESKPGGGTNIGTQTVVNSPPDGYTLLMFGSAAAINATFYVTLRYRAGCRTCRLLARAGRAPVGPGPDRCRVNRLCQGSSG